MADVARNTVLERYCIHYFDTRNCPLGDRCLYQHRARFEVEKVEHVDGLEFFLGRLRTNQRICRFYLRGNCIHQQNCHYRHENNTAMPNSSRNNSDESACPTRNSSNSNPPSTSQNVDITNANPIDITEMKNNEEEINSCHGENDNESQKEEGACASPSLTSSSINESWVNAPEFVPKNIRPRSYAEALNPEAIAERNANRKLCPYVNKDGICRNLTDCTYLHGDMCDMCERLVLHPYNQDQRKKHRQECLKQHEKNMELSFAIARSKERTCGVCFEIIMEKANGEQRFGILPNCNHCFCLSCIRKWRQARQFENKIIRACPECRVTSDFVCPSMYWVETKEDKDKLIDDYKNALSRKDCKYFRKGQGKCPFGNKCFYLHAFPDGSTCDVGPPVRQRRPRNVDNEIDVLQL